MLQTSSGAKPLRLEPPHNVLLRISPSFIARKIMSECTLNAHKGLCPSANQWKSNRRSFKEDRTVCCGVKGSRQLFEGEWGLIFFICPYTLWLRFGRVFAGWEVQLIQKSVFLPRTGDTTLVHLAVYSHSGQLATDFNNKVVAPRWLMIKKIT